MKCPSKEQLEQDFNNGMMWNDIATKYGYSSPTFLRKVAKRYGLKKRNIITPTKEMLEDLILNQRLSPNEVALKLGYSSGGWSNIYKYCRDFGIPVDFHPNSDIRKKDLTDLQKSFVVGTVLGDGYLRTSRKSVSLSITHGIKQLDYLLWCRNILGDFVKTEPKEHISTSSLGHQNTFVFSTISHPYFKELKDIFYPNGIKTITLEWLNMVDDFALAVWYMDDGSRNKRYKTITLCTNCFSYDEHLIIQKWFLEKYSIPCVIEKRRNNQFSIRINAKYSSTFLSIVSPYIPQCMRYKLGE